MTESPARNNPIWAGTICETVLAVSVQQLTQSLLEKPPLRLLLGEA